MTIKVTSLGEKMSGDFVEFFNDKIYEVNSFGKTFKRCRVIGYCDDCGIKSWRFESLDVETKGYKFSTWDRNSFKVVEN